MWLLLERADAVWMHAAHISKTAAQGEHTGAIGSGSVGSSRREERRSGQTAAAHCSAATVAHRPPHRAHCAHWRSTHLRTRYTSAASPVTRLGRLCGDQCASRNFHRVRVRQNRKSNTDHSYIYVYSLSLLQLPSSIALLLDQHCDFSLPFVLSFSKAARRRSGRQTGRGDLGRQGRCVWGAVSMRRRLAPLALTLAALAGPL